MKRILNQQHYGRLNEGWVKWVGWWGACSHVQGSRSLQAIVAVIREPNVHGLVAPLL